MRYACDEGVGLEEKGGAWNAVESSASSLVGAVLRCWAPDCFS